MLGPTNEIIEENIHRFNLEKTRKNITKIMMKQVAIGAAFAAASAQRRRPEQVTVKVDAAEGMIAKLIAAND